MRARRRNLIGGKILIRLIKEIAMAAKNGGGNPESNPRLRIAVAAAKAENMPADNIKRAIQRGTGEIPGANYEEFTFEGYGPGGVAVLVEVITDDLVRVKSEIRRAFTKGGGNMGEVDSVSWMFQKKGFIVVSKATSKEDDLMSIVIEHGGDDLNENGDNWEITTHPNAFYEVLEAVGRSGAEVVHSEVGMIPKGHMKLEGAIANQVRRLLDTLEDQDDVQNVYTNWDDRISADIVFTFDSSLSPQQVKLTLRALADYYRACGGVGFEIDTELEEILVSELAYA